MPAKLLFIICVLMGNFLCSDAQVINLNNHWQFRQFANTTWHPATVPGTIHTDLFKNDLIPDPFFGDNEKRLQWIDSSSWEYQTIFNSDAKTISHRNAQLIFDGLDTYASVYLNDSLVLQANNMFRKWTVDVTGLLKPVNKLNIVFRSAQNINDSLAKAALPLVRPDNNRVYTRKAAFQFGWDWGPRFISAGIWKNVYLQTATLPYVNNKYLHIPAPIAKLVQQEDSSGSSFYFEQDGKPVYAKGANWIPANIFLPEVKESDYRKLLVLAKEANMNMLRVWGGGIYESDLFYELCDSLGIMVWQDFMFAGAMYPGDTDFFANVKEEVKYQLKRLEKHPSIVVWCGNNEIDEAWHHWGWQQQFNIHGKDSAKIWQDYEALFKDSLKAWVAVYDHHQRPYISTSPKYGWGNAKSYSYADSHYWGLWWGLQGWEAFEEKTGRFVSEYGMQAMPDYTTIEKYTNPANRTIEDPIIQWHQKANEGFKKLNYYVDRYFLDSAYIKQLSLRQYSYLTQCVQYYVLKNSIAIHRSKQPFNMGTLLWQFNDCWPVTSWSIVDFYGNKKAGWYAVKEAYRHDAMPAKDSVYPKMLKLNKPRFILKNYAKDAISIIADEDAYYVHLYADGEALNASENYFNLKKSEVKIILLKDNKLPLRSIKTMSLFDVMQK